MSGQDAARGFDFRPVASTLQARSLAIVGASERARWPSEILRNLRELGYPGPVQLVNPRQREVLGQRCHPSLRDLPAPVEHALVIVPAAAVPEVLTEAEAAGVGSATVYASMMGEGEAAQSKARGAWLAQFVAKSRLRIAGPNCMGSFSYRERLFGYPNTELCRLPPGPVACLFQSGGTLQLWMQSAADRGLRFSYCVTSGNEADLDLADYLDFVIDDPETHLIVLFIEGLRRPAPFMQAAGRALAMGKPVLAIKTGAGSRSQAASLSHTGAIAGDFTSYLAMCERYGIVNCRSLDDLLEMALAFGVGRLPRGPRIAFVTPSGGAVDLLHDYGETEGAVIPDLAPSTKAALLPLMQEGISPANPLDMGIPPPLATAAAICATVAGDAGIDMVAWALPLPRKDSAFGDLTPMRDMLASTDKPVVGFARMVHQGGEGHLAAQEAAGFPFLQGMQATVRALNGLWFHAARRGRLPASPAPAAPSRLTPATLEATLSGYGIVPAQSAAVASIGEAVAAAERIGFPVALKIRSRDILHKTEAGGVALDLRDRGEVAAAATALVAAAHAAHPDASIEGYLVQEMVSGIETIVGARSDPHYGPVLLMGAGGILAELANDAALRLLPLEADDVRAMIEGLKLARLLAAFRGRPPADRGALESTALALGRLFLDHRSRIAEIEINPLTLRPAGGGAVAVDVRVLWREGAA
jgi:acetyltransferase